MPASATALGHGRSPVGWWSRWSGIQVLRISVIHGRPCCQRETHVPMPTFGPRLPPRHHHRLADRATAVPPAIQPLQNARIGSYPFQRTGGWAAHQENPDLYRQPRANGR